MADEFATMAAVLRGHRAQRTPWPDAWPAAVAGAPRRVWQRNGSSSLRSVLPRPIT